MRRTGAKPLLALFLSLVLSPEGRAELISKQLVRARAIEMLERSDCKSKLDGLRALKHADGEQSAVFHEYAATVFSACVDPREKATALLLGLSSPGNLTESALGRVEESLNVGPPILRWTASAILARSGKLVEHDLRQGPIATDDPETLLFFCGLIGAKSADQRCDSIRLNFEEWLYRLLSFQPDELLALEAQLLGDGFPAEALESSLELYRQCLERVCRRADAISIVRAAWAESDANQLLAESIAGTQVASADKLIQIAFLRLSTPSSIEVLGAALRSDDTERVHLGIAAAGALGPSAVDLAPFLKELALGRDEDIVRRRAALTLVTISPVYADRLAEEVREKDTELFLLLKKGLLEQALD